MAQAYAKAHFGSHEDPAPRSPHAFDLSTGGDGAENERAERRLRKLPKDGGELPNETRHAQRSHHVVEHLQARDVVLEGGVVLVDEDVELYDEAVFSGALHFAGHEDFA